MGIISWIKNKIEEQNNLRLERQKLEEKRISNEKDKRRFQRWLLEFNSKKYDNKNCQPIKRAVGYQLYRIFNTLNSETQEEIKHEYGEPLVFLINKMAREFLTEQEEDLFKYGLKKEEHLKLYVRCFVQDEWEKGLIFVDDNNQYYWGNFFEICNNPWQDKFIDNNELWQEISTSEYIGNGEREYNDYLYSNDLDIIIKEEIYHPHFSRKEISAMGIDSYSAHNTIYYSYKIIYNISKKVKLIDDSFVKDNKEKYPKTFEYLGIKVEH